MPLGFQPGSTWDYSYSTDVLGRVVEVVAGKPLGEVLRERVFEPLAMADTAFYVTDANKHGRIAEPFPDDRAIGAGVAFNDPRVATKMESAGGGLTGTARDYARFAQMLLEGGELDDTRILGPATLEYMTSDHLGSSIDRGKLYCRATATASASVSEYAPTPASPASPAPWASTTGAAPAATTLGSTRGRARGRLHDAVAQEPVPNRQPAAQSVYGRSSTRRPEGTGSGRLSRCCHGQQPPHSSEASPSYGPQQRPDARQSDDRPIASRADKLGCLPGQGICRSVRSPPQGR